ncbi:hypothetical protein QF035_011060 [Streptomyces umbrinus]|uniref:DUF2637 domain-containing protein n=1 Tax=Streptomyces umbrinus TaxID=67370 RepID=A0ABU0TCC7_9ACTN|nr:DUF2637 domain-containing protein [Streptomyces umbrinus]MDQ1033478.1 hypothetical protein [Streptomyces umbrinus]
MNQGQQRTSAGSTNRAVEAGRAHRLLIGVVVFGTVVIAGIGFAGSYAAVRELALQKGFGKFSYVFPIGIDAGICVLLALDLLLTWIRIPFPLLRQTAWLLTAATIAFNGAAAWPDPLGVGMHGVIPILFVVSVEAARHAIGRIADITADKHMEGVRLTRWLLSPLPTFLLWRRMKLWELRSYEQVIKLEQERLVYQARLRSRFGRAWRRKAPVESLMPLRLARYGVPLAETAPSGLAAAGIEPALLPPAPRQQTEPAQAATPPDAATRTEPAAHGHTTPQTSTTAHVNATTQASAQAPHEEQRRQEPDRTPAPDEQQQSDRAQEQPEYLEEEPESSPWFAPPQQEIIYEGGYDPSYAPDQMWAQYQAQQAQYEAEQRQAYQNGHGQVLQEYEKREPSPEDTGTPSTPKGTGPTRQPSQSSAQEPEPAQGPHQETAPPLVTLPAQDRHTRPVKASLTNTPAGDTPAPPPALSELPTVDRYYLAWQTFQQQHGHEPQGPELSQYLAERNVLDRDGRPIKPRALTRYYLEFRIYTTWADHRAHTTSPRLDQVARDLTQRGITAQYNKPIQPSDLNKYIDTFQRRWNTLQPRSRAAPTHTPR